MTEGDKRTSLPLGVVATRPVGRTADPANFTLATSGCAPGARQAESLWLSSVTEFTPVSLTAKQKAPGTARGSLAAGGSASFTSIPISVSYPTVSARDAPPRSGERGGQRGGEPAAALKADAG